MAKDRKGGKATVISTLLAVGTVVGLALGAWVFVIGTRDIGTDTQEAANRAADQEAGFTIQTAHITFEDGGHVLHVIAGPATSSTSAAIAAIQFRLDGEPIDPVWGAFRDADGSLDGGAPLLNGGDLIELEIPIDPESVGGHVTLSMGASDTTLGVPAHVGRGITSLTILG